MIIDRRIFWYLKSQIYYRWFFKKFGKMSYLGPYAYLKGVNKIEISNRVRIFPGARIELHGNEAALRINKNVSIGHNVHIICSGLLIIDEGTTIASNVFINDLETTFTKTNQEFKDQPTSTKETYIGKFCFIGVNTSIQAGSILKDNTIVGSNSFVKGRFEKNSIIGGVPAKFLKSINESE